MLEKKIKVKSEHGLHARPASDFVKQAGAFASEVYIVKGDQRANGKSIMNLLAMQVGKGDEILLEVNGEDEREAMECLASIIEEGTD